MYKELGDGVENAEKSHIGKMSSMSSSASRGSGREIFYSVSSQADGTSSVDLILGNEDAQRNDERLDEGEHTPGWSCACSCCYNFTNCIDAFCYCKCVAANLMKFACQHFAISSRSRSCCHASCKAESFEAVAAGRGFCS